MKKIFETKAIKSFGSLVRIDQQEFVLVRENSYGYLKTRFHVYNEFYGLIEGDVWSRSANDWNSVKRFLDLSGIGK